MVWKYVQVTCASFVTTNTCQVFFSNPVIVVYALYSLRSIFSGTKSSFEAHARLRCVYFPLVQIKLYCIVLLCVIEPWNFFLMSYYTYKKKKSLLLKHFEGCCMLLIAGWRVYWGDVEKARGRWVWNYREFWNFHPCFCPSVGSSTSRCSLGKIRIFLLFIVYKL